MGSRVADIKKRIREIEKVRDIKELCMMLDNHFSLPTPMGTQHEDIDIDTYFCMNVYSNHWAM